MAYIKAYSRFSASLAPGFADYGISINPAKTRANFDALPGWPRFRCTYQTSDGQEFIKWCGLLVNCTTLEVQADYTRYSNQELESSLSLTLHKASADKDVIMQICKS